MFIHWGRIANAFWAGRLEGASLYDSIRPLDPQNSQRGLVDGKKKAAPVRVINMIYSAFSEITSEGGGDDTSSDDDARQSDRHRHRRRRHRGRKKDKRLISIDGSQGPAINSIDADAAGRVGGDVIINDGSSATGYNVNMSSAESHSGLAMVDSRGSSGGQRTHDDFSDSDENYYSSDNDDTDYSDNEREPLFVARGEVHPYYN